jgi:protease-4
MRKFFEKILINIFSLIAFLVLVIFVSITSLWIYLKNKEAYSPKPNTILVLDLQDNIYEHHFRKNLIKYYYDETDEALDIPTLKSALIKAKSDPNIRGILLLSKDLENGWAQLEEIRSMLLDFKTSNKPIISWGDSYTNKSYYLASTSDKIFLHPEGNVHFSGMVYKVNFLKGLLDKLALEPIIFKAGKYKSAVEPLTRKDMSPENKEQAQTMIKSIQSNLLKAISQSRNITIAKLITVCDDIKNVIAQNSLKEKLVDQLGFMSDVMQFYQDRLGLENENAIHYTKINKYANLTNKQKKISQNKIAIIFAEGTILDKESLNEAKVIEATRLTKVLKRIKKDNTIKGVVLRINSPGGGVLPSVNLWNEIKLLAKEKPVIASMSDVCASGGYYMALACNQILASNYTITGSIGVFDIWYNKNKMLEDKLGITSDWVKTNKSSDIIFSKRELNRDLSIAEKTTLQKAVDATYENFIEKVVESRNITKQKAFSLGEGRIWSGEMALENKLIDKIGSLDDAVQVAASMANIENYTISYWPQPQMQFYNLNYNLKQIFLEKAGLNFLFDRNRDLEELNNMQGIQARLLYDIKLY